MNNNRISELDWLRVILILAVFLHHVLMPFNGDGWHIMNAQSSKLLDDIMVYFEQFRLPILFFIAGVGSVLLLRKVHPYQFLHDKFLRLFVPLLIGVLIVVPPQGYIEDIAKYDSFLQAFPKLALKFDSNHLWFIEYLVVFSLLAVPFHLFLESQWASSLKEFLEWLSDTSCGLFGLVLVLIILRVGLKLYFPDNGHGIDNLSSSLFYLFFFAAGMICIQSQKVWLSLEKYRRKNFTWLLVSSFIFYGYYYSPDLSEYLSLQTRWSIWWFVCCLVAWSALLTLLGYAQRHLTTTPKWLKLSNELIFPFYIFHQTVIVVVGYHVISLPISLTYKAMILAISAFFITAAICLLVIYPFNLTRRFFGLKPRRSNVSDGIAYNKAVRRPARET
ncbi:acyltransferase [Microbulbifer sp. THAF38]|uniref:acyltransferase family protein n=1 Tax=Microbulbifer sp. THAF38 TaxID=2587856 RepID=UPI0012684B72|nr:acyltransferase [Microbulbifer sp. THAF38]QFT55160.1 glucans biosynthesis protein [Microbulbifer sp. THAF38]